MKAQETENAITNKLALLARMIEQHNAGRKYDINTICQSSLVPLFRLVFKLEDLCDLDQAIHANFPAIDLGDRKRRVAFQITSAKRPEKVKITISAFLDESRKGGALCRDYDELFIYVLTDKQGSYSQKAIDKVTAGRLDFSAVDNILDRFDLEARIKQLEHDEKKEVLRVLENVVGDGGVLDLEPTKTLDRMFHRSLWAAFFPALLWCIPILSGRFRDYYYEATGIFVAIALPILVAQGAAIVLVDRQQLLDLRVTLWRRPLMALVVAYFTIISLLAVSWPLFSLTIAIQPLVLLRRALGPLLAFQSIWICLYWLLLSRKK